MSLEFSRRAILHAVTGTRLGNLLEALIPQSISPLTKASTSTKSDDSFDSVSANGWLLSRSSRDLDVSFMPVLISTEETLEFTILVLLLDNLLSFVDSPEIEASLVSTLQKR